MMTEVNELLALLQEIRDLIDRNQKPDGTVCFDVLRGRIALEFARAEIQKSVRAYNEPVSYTHLTLPTILLV